MYEVNVEKLVLKVPQGFQVHKVQLVALENQQRMVYQALQVKICQVNEDLKVNPVKIGLHQSILWQKSIFPLKTVNQVFQDDKVDLVNVEKPVKTVETVLMD